MVNSSPNSTTVIVDDTDLALVYTGVWVRGGVPSEFDASTHGTAQRGASVLFTFRGTSVAVYGTIGTDTPSSAYTLDNTVPSTFTAPKVGAPVYQQLFFNSSTLADGEHTLLVTNLVASNLWIDYFLYTESGPQPASSSTSSLTPSSMLSLQSTLTSSTRTPNVDTPSPIPSLTSSGTTSSSGITDHVNSNRKSSIPISAVAGGAVGVLILIVALIFGMLYYRRRANRLAGEKLGKDDVFGDPSLTDKADASASIIPFTGAYPPGLHDPFGRGSSNTNMYPPGPVYPPSDYAYQNQSQPSTPIYHFSNHYSPRPDFNVSSDNIAGVGTGPGHGKVDHTSSQYGDAQYGYMSSVGQPDYFQNHRPQYNGAEQHPYASPDRLQLQVPERRNSRESAESRASLAYLSGDRVAMNPSSPLPDALPSPQPAPQQSEKNGFIVHNPEICQHEDGGVRLDVEQSRGSASRQQQVVDVPPVYKPNY